MYKKVYVIFFLCVFVPATLSAFDLDKVYSERLKKEVDEPVLYNSAARYYLLNSKRNKAEEVLKKNLSRHPEDNDSLFLMSAIKVESGKYKEAKDMLMQLISRNPQNMSYISLLIHIFVKTGNNEMAEKYRSFLKGNNASKGQIRHDSVNSIIKIASATSIIREAQKNKIDKLKNDKKTLYFKTSKLPLEKQEAIAEEFASKIQAMNEADGGFNQMDMKERYEMMRSILETAPDSKYAQMTHWGLHYFHYGLSSADGSEDYVELQACLESYLAKYPDDHVNKKEAYDKLAIVAKKLNDWNSMLYYSELYLSEDPDSVPMLYNHASALLNLGEIARGSEMLEKIAGNPDGSVQYWLAKQDLEEIKGKQ